MKNNSLYHFFTSHEWTDHVNISSAQIKAIDNKLLFIDNPINTNEIIKTYLPLSYFLLIDVISNKKKCQQYDKFLSIKKTTKTTLTIGITGSVSVGKSTVASVICLLLQQISNFKVSLISTDNFLFPNEILTKKNLMHRKGFPESYDVNKIIRFLYDVKYEKKKVFVPRYSHSEYDILEGEFYEINQPDIILIEGVNILQQNTSLDVHKNTPIISDFLDFSIYIDADEKDIYQWYLNRFMELRTKALLDPSSYFYRLNKISEKNSLQIAEKAWHEINLPNLKQHILPTRGRANIILSKANNHLVETIAIRKL
ncbi:type I pantothenate kinase [Candidatus Liberibacter brunswickensis]